MKSLYFLILSLLFIGLPSVSFAQNLIMHVDPLAREEGLETVKLPALRFLTTSDYPPFNYTDEDGRLIGFNIDLATAICAVLEARCTIQSWPWDKVQQALADNQGDAIISGINISPETSDTLDFSRIYLQLPARFAALKGAAVQFDQNNLSGIVAVREGSPHAALLKRHYPALQFKLYETEFAALDAVKTAEAKLYFGDAVRASFWLNQNQSCCSFAGSAIFRPDLFGEGLAVAVPVGLNNVRSAINWALARVSAEGRLDEIYLRWFPVGFY